MTVIGDFAFPGEYFVLNGTIDVPEIDIEIERLVAHIGEGLTPYFRISATDIEEVERTLEADPTVEDIEQLEAIENERFYRARWTNGSHGLVTVLQKTEGAVTFHEGKWEVRVLFADRENLREFYDQCQDELDFSVELLRVFDQSNPATYGEYGLTQEQRDALLIALEMGYFDVPKQGDVEDIAADSISPRRRSHSGCAEATGTSLRIPSGFTTPARTLERIAFWLRESIDGSLYDLIIYHIVFIHPAPRSIQYLSNLSEN